MEQIIESEKRLRLFTVAWIAVLTVMRLTGIMWLEVYILCVSLLAGALIANIAAARY